MLVAELLIRKENIKNRIKELRNYITKAWTDKEFEFDNTGVTYTKILSILFDLIEKYQDYSVILSKTNYSTMIKVGNSEISVENAVKIRNTIEAKIQLISDLVNNDSTVDVFNLIDQREGLIEECLLLTIKIKTSDWSTEID